MAGRLRARSLEERLERYRNDASARAALELRVARSQRHRHRARAPVTPLEPTEPQAAAPAPSLPLPKAAWRRIANAARSGPASALESVPGPTDVPPHAPDSPLHPLCDSTGSHATVPTSPLPAPAQPVAHGRRKGALSSRAAQSRTAIIEPMPPPPLPDNVSPQVAALIERARGDRMRDPLETGSVLIRKRCKALELDGSFRCGMGSTEVDRLVPALGCSSDGAASSGGCTPRQVGLEAAAKWLGPDFTLTSRIPSTALADASVLTSHRTPFVDAAKREQSTYRQRDRSAEVSPRLERLPPALAAPLSIVEIEQQQSEALAKRGGTGATTTAGSATAPARSPRAAHAEALHAMHRVREIGDVEMSAARALISTRLSIHRK